MGVNQRWHDNSPSQERDIAIIGMACLFPGAPDLHSYWRNIVGKVDAITDPPAEAWDPDVFYDPGSNANDRLYCKRGGFLGPLAYFDPIKHQVMPRAVLGSEPDQWLALQVARAAFADAGYGDEIPERHKTAVILGKGNYPNRGNSTVSQHGHVVDQTLTILKMLHPEYSEDELALLRAELKRSLPPFNSDTAPGLIPNIAAGRIANQLDLMGPSYTVDAACASFLVAAQAALRGLRSGELDLALVGGVQVWTPAPMLMLFSQLGALSRQQQIRPFDANADGTILGEGVGMVVLKRLTDAKRDKNRIYAVIKGVGIASDGRGLGVLAPRLEGEVLALEKAYEDAGVSPRSVALIEAHGTGTPTGDATELEALAHVFGQREGLAPPCALGSVKSMVGHLLPAAGVAGLIKTALALYYKVLPPTLNVDAPHPKLADERSYFYLNTEARPWVHGERATPRRAGVNAFGFGGINGHMVLEEYTAPTPQPPADDPLAWESEAILLFAESRAGLLEQIRSVRRYAESDATLRLADLAYTLNCAEPAGERPLCLGLVVASVADLLEKLSQAESRLADPQCRRIKDVRGIYFSEEPLARAGKVAFLFPGEGSQYPNMLAELCLHFPEVRAQFDLTDRIFAGKGRPFHPSDYIFPRTSVHSTGQGPSTTGLWDMDHAVESLLTANQALYLLLRGLDVQPDALLGHSSGDYSALLASGMLNLADEASFEAFAQELNEVGQTAGGDATSRATLLAIGADAPTVAPLVEQAGGSLYLAMVNCPHQTVVAGDEEAAERLSAQLHSRGLLYERLPFDRPYHTPLCRGLGGRLRPFFRRWLTASPQVPVYSCTTAARYPSSLEEMQALAVEHWLRPVDFSGAVEAMYADGFRIFVEVGTRGNLTSFVGDILRGRPHLAVAANVMSRSEITQLNHLVALLAAHGVAMKLDYLYQRRGPQRLRLDAPPSQDARQGPDTTLKLPTGWPAMTISDETAQRLRRSPEPVLPQASVQRYQNGGGQHTTPAVRPDAPNAVGRAPVEHAPAPAGPAHPPASIPAQVFAPSAPPLPAPAAHGTGPGTGPRAGAGRVMSAYFETMNQFLAVQEEVMQSFLAGRGLPAAQLQPNAAEPAHRPVANNGHWPQEAEPLPTQPSPSADAPVTPAPQPAVAEPSSLPVPTMDAQGVRSLLLRLVSERTGYPLDVLDVDLDLEANLGIDSIKRVEILGHFQREAGVSLSAAMESLSSRKTLREIIELLAQQLDGASAPASSQSGATAPAASPQMAGPFAGTLIAWTPGEAVEVQRTLSLERDRFLLDHTLSRRVSVTDPALPGLPVMPLTMSVEAMAEAAALLAPGMVLVGVRDLRALRWIVVETGELPLVITAAHRAGGIYASIREQGESQTAGKDDSPLVEATFLFASGYPPSPPAAALTLRGDRPSRWLPEQLYEEGMFHGPLFRGVHSMDRWGEDGAEATVQLLAPDGLFARGNKAGSDGRAMLTDPVLLDQPGQVVAFWMSERMGRQTMMLPFHLRALDLYGPPWWRQPATPEHAAPAVTCRARISLKGAAQVESDLELVQADGRLLARLSGWSDRCFDLPASFIRFQLAPGKEALSTPLSYLSDRWPELAGLVLRQLQADWFPDEMFTGAGGIWQRVLAHTALSRRERTIWRSLDGSANRRLEWLLGRIVAKDALRDLVRRQHGLSLCPADIEILADENGRPVVAGAWLNTLSEAPVVSISHADGVLIALAASGAEGVGVDVQQLDRRHNNFEMLAFTDEERALLASLPAPFDEWRMRLWCAKEAAGKALGVGLLGGPQALVVQSVDVAGGRLHLGLTGVLAARFPNVAAAGMTAYTICADSLVVAASIYSPTLERQVTV